MRIFVPNESKQSVGGGWSFLRNFQKYAERRGAEVVTSNYKHQEGDILFIPGATMVTRDLVHAAKEAGMKVVLRIDNAPRNSRNRNTGTSRLRDFAGIADMIVYQSDWAKRYLSGWLGREGQIPQPVIINGADHEIFNPDGPAQPREADTQFLYVRSSRDETKRWEEAWYEFSMAHQTIPNCHLWIAGPFAKEHIEYNFDFFMGERHRYVGMIESPEDMAEYFRSTDWLLAPFYNDACSNTLIEARLCGVKKIHYSETGGTPQLMNTPLKELTADFMTVRYLEEMSRL